MIIIIAITFILLLRRLLLLLLIIIIVVISINNITVMASNLQWKNRRQIHACLGGLPSTGPSRMGVETLCTKQLSGTVQGALSSSKRITSFGFPADNSEPGT